VKAGLLICVVASFCCAVAQERVVRGTVTYIAAGTVYTSLGTTAGVKDSTEIVCFSGSDTTATLKVTAVSSKSSACRILQTNTAIHIGDSVRASIVEEKSVEQPVRSPQNTDATTAGSVPTAATAAAAARARPSSSSFKVRGRVGLQYTSIAYETSIYDFRQPGLVMNFSGTDQTIPLKVDFYGTFRSQTRGSAALFSSSSTTDSRVYRLAVGYDDGGTILAVGRILPSFAASVGIIDGLSIARRWNSLTGGVSVGFQPGVTLGAPSFDQRKAILFGQYEARDAWNTTAAAAFTTVLSDAGIERQTVSATASTYIPSGFSIYSSTDVDVRAPSSAGNGLSPQVSLLIVSMSYRINQLFGIGFGFDASRPTYTFSFAQVLPDSLIDRRLRSGANLTLNVSFPSGVGLTNTYTPRSSENAFGKEYANSTSAYATNVFESGLSVRASLSLTESQQSEVRGGTVAVQRTILGVDLGLRYQQSYFQLHQSDLSNVAESFGVDASGTIARAFTWMVSMDRSWGLNEQAETIFLELSWRF